MPPKILVYLGVHFDALNIDKDISSAGVRQNSTFSFLHLFFHSPMASEIPFKNT